MRRYLISFLLLSIISCKENKGIVSKDENGGDPVYSVTGEDPEMNQAIEKARNEFPLFVQILKKGDSNVSDFSVKMRFDYDGNNGEHMWLSQIHVKQDKLFGILDSDPVNIHKVSAGDTIAIDEALVSDWMFVKDNKMKGGYTLKILYNKMTEAEKRKLREEFPFDIE